MQELILLLIGPAETLKFISIKQEFYKGEKKLSSSFSTSGVRNNCALQQNGSQKKEVQRYQL